MSTSKYCCNQTKKARKTRLRSFERSFKKLLFAYVFFSFWSKQAFKTTVWSHFLWKNFHDFLTHKPRWFNWMLCLNGLSYKNELSPIWKIFSKGFSTSYDFLHLKKFYVSILYKPFANIIFYFPSVMWTMNKRREEQKSHDYMKLKSEEQEKPIFPGESNETVKGRTENQNPMWAKRSVKGRIEIP